MKSRLFASLDGMRILLGVALLFDAIRCWCSPDASLLGLLVRRPGGVSLPCVAGIALGASLLMSRRISALGVAPFALLAAWDVVEYYRLLARGLVAAPVPFSLLVFALLSWWCLRPFVRVPDARRLWRVMGALVGCGMILLVHVLTFGATDYERPADAIVVFGAKVHKDGRPSDALEDRVNHGVVLYRGGVAPVLVLSGGSDEVPVMRAMAIERGVPASAIEVDPAGANTLATMRNLRHRRVVAVSHYYHLARIKLTAERLGIACATVPCRMPRRLVKEVYFVLRECAAYAFYYLRVGAP